MTYSNGDLIAGYREATNASHAKMAGVSFHTFWCRICNRARKIKGRKSLGHKNGFQCSECAGAME